MTLGTSDYALLAQDVYQDPTIGKALNLGGVDYRAIDHLDTSTGFQATAYERLDTNEIIIAFRGTEFGRKPVKDGGIDAGMVLAGVNAQTPDAFAFTARVLKQAQDSAQINHRPVAITVTGHSLGGTLAEISAAKFGLHGETFNAYGAAGLLQGVPQGGHQVIDHVRATDLVSAASKHFGEVRVYASRQDIDTLTKAGYRDDSTLLSPRNPFRAIDFKAHAMENFVEGNKLLGHSIISPEGRAMYREHQQTIDRYRHDVMDLRTGLSLSWEIPKAEVQLGEAAGHAVAAKVVEGWHAAEHAASHVSHEVSQTYGRTSKAVTNEVVHDVHATGQAARRVEGMAERAYDHASKVLKQDVVGAAHAVEQGAQAIAHGAERAYDGVRKDVSQGVEAAGHALRSADTAIHDKAAGAFDALTHPGSWFDSKPGKDVPSLDHPAHPDHALFQQARAAVHRLDTTHKRVPDQGSEHLAGALTVAARGAGLHDIHHAVLSDDARRAYAVQGELQSPFKRIAQVDMAQAMSTPIAQSSAQWVQQQATPPVEAALVHKEPVPQHDRLVPGP